jgi:hypothetical protein
MKRHQITIGLLICVGLAFIFSSCNKDPYFHYVVEGRVIDKTTKEPVKDIMVSSVRYDILRSQPKNSQKVSPPENDGWSDANGEFRTYRPFTYSLIYIYDYENGLYKDTIISVDFSNVPLSGKPSKNYKGDYILNIGDIELEKQIK